MPEDIIIDFKVRSAQIRDWVQGAQGRWDTRKLDYELNIQSADAKALRRQALKRLCDEGVCERIPHMEGVYRTVEGPPTEVNWQQAKTPEVKLQFPFGLEQYVKIHSKGIIVVAGDKDAGKTPFCYGVVLLNMFHPLGVDLFYNGEGPLRERMYSSSIEIPNPAPFRVFERMDAFDQVIDPDRISVIDYLDLGSEVYLVGEEIEKIFKKLSKGVAVIALQKPPPSVTYVKGQKKLIHRDLAYGSGFTAKRAQLYISLDGSKLKLVYAKNRAIPTVNPKNKLWSYRFDERGWFKDIAEFHPPLADEGEEV